jgi:predicted MFS family arabinose efflux permease
MTDKRGVGRAAQITTMALLSIVSLFNYMDRMLLAAVSQPIKTEFGLSDTQLGLLTGVTFAFFYAMMGIPMGRMADRLSRKHMLAICLGCWSVMTAVTGWATSYVQLLLARMFIAVGESGCTPTSYSLIADTFIARHRNLALGLFNGASMIGVVLGFALGGWISQTYGWRAAFHFLGAPGIILAVGILFVMKEPIRGIMDGKLADKAPPTRVALRTLLGNKAFVFLLLGLGFNSIGVYGVSQWMPQFFIRSHGLSLAQVGFLFGIAFGLGMFVGNLLGGVIGQRLGRHGLGTPMLLSVITSLIIIPLYFGALLIETHSIAIVITAAAAVIGAAANPPSSAACQNFVPADVRATAAALTLLSVAIMGIGLGPLLIGMASDALTPHFGTDGLRYALMALQIVNLLAAIFYGLAGREGNKLALPVMDARV